MSDEESSPSPGKKERKRRFNPADYDDILEEETSTSAAPKKAKKPSRKLDPGSPYPFESDTAAEEEFLLEWPKDSGIFLKGYVARPEYQLTNIYRADNDFSPKALTTKLNTPVVLVFPSYCGLKMWDRHVAGWFARLGYIGLACDYYTEEELDPVVRDRSEVMFGPDPPPSPREEVAERAADPVGVEGEVVGTGEQASEAGGGSGSSAAAVGGSGSSAQLPPESPAAGGSGSSASSAQASPTSKEQPAAPEAGDGDASANIKPPDSPKNPDSPPPNPGSPPDEPAQTADEPRNKKKEEPRPPTPPEKSAWKKTRLLATEQQTEKQLRDRKLKNHRIQSLEAMNGLLLKQIKERFRPLVFAWATAARKRLAGGAAAARIAAFGYCVGGLAGLELVRAGFVPLNGIVSLSGPLVAREIQDYKTDPPLPKEPEPGEIVDSDADIELTSSDEEKNEARRAREDAARLEKKNAEQAALDEQQRFKAEIGPAASSIKILIEHPESSPICSRTCIEQFDREVKVANEELDKNWSVVWHRHKDAKHGFNVVPGVGFFCVVV